MALRVQMFDLLEIEVRHNNELIDPELRQAIGILAAHVTVASGLAIASDRAGALEYSNGISGCNLHRSLAGVIDRTWVGSTADEHAYSFSMSVLCCHMQQS